MYFLYNFLTFAGIKDPDKNGMEYISFFVTRHGMTGSCGTTLVHG